MVRESGGKGRRELLGKESPQHSYKQQLLSQHPKSEPLPLDDIGSATKYKRIFPHPPSLPPFHPPPHLATGILYLSWLLEDTEDLRNPASLDTKPL